MAQAKPTVYEFTLSGVPYLGLAVIDPHPVWLVVLVVAARYGTRGLAVVIPIAWGALALANGSDGPGAGARHAGDADRAGRAGGDGAGRVDRVGERAPRARARRQGRGARTPRGRRQRDDRRPAPRRAGAARAQRSPRSVADVPAQHRAAPARVRRRGGAPRRRWSWSSRASARARRRSRCWPGGELRSLAVIGVWNRGAPDNTALAAMSGRQPVRAVELTAGGPDDSDIAAPIIDASGVVRGVIAARGVPGGGSSMAALPQTSPSSPTGHRPRFATRSPGGIGATAQSRRREAPRAGPEKRANRARTNPRR